MLYSTLAALSHLKYAVGVLTVPYFQSTFIKLFSTNHITAFIMETI